MIQKKSYSEIIKYLVILDLIVFLVSIIPKERNLLSYSFIIFNIITVCLIWYVKSKYKSWDEVINYPLYLLLLFILPEAITKSLIYMGINENMLISYRVEHVLYMVSKLILYVRIYKILKSNPELDKIIFD